MIERVKYISCNLVVCSTNI